jgi:hypothetical protein
MRPGVAIPMLMEQKLDEPASLVPALAGVVPVAPEASVYPASERAEAVAG